MAEVRQLHTVEREQHHSVDFDRLFDFGDQDALIGKITARHHDDDERAKEAFKYITSLVYFLKEISPRSLPCLAGLARIAQREDAPGVGVGQDEFATRLREAQDAEDAWRRSHGRRRASAQPDDYTRTKTAHDAWYGAWRALLETPASDLSELLAKIDVWRRWSCDLEEVQSDEIAEIVADVERLAIVAELPLPKVNA